MRSPRFAACTRNRDEATPTRPLPDPHAQPRAMTPTDAEAIYCEGRAAAKSW